MCQMWEGGSKVLAVPSNRTISFGQDTVEILVGDGAPGGKTCAGEPNSVQFSISCNPAIPPSAIQFEIVSYAPYTCTYGLKAQSSAVCKSPSPPSPPPPPFLFSEPPGVAFEYLSLTDSLTFAFSPWLASESTSLGLMLDTCSADDPTTCINHQSSRYTISSCTSHINPNNAVVVANLGSQTPETTTFGGQYMVYERYDVPLSGNRALPAENIIEVYFCPSLGCAKSITQNHASAIVQNGYWPSFGFVALALGSRMPVIGYVAVQGESGNLPSDHHTGQLFVTICSTSSCDGVEMPYKVLLDTCVDPSNSGGVPLCAGVSLTISNGNPLILYTGPSSEPKGMSLKMLACTDRKCSTSPQPADIVQVSSDFAPVVTNAVITTRSNGYPVFVFTSPVNGELVLTLCSTYTCSEQTSNVIKSGLLGVVNSDAHIAIGPNGIPYIVYVRDVRLNTSVQNAIMIFHCLSESCSTWSEPELIVESDSLGRYRAPKVTPTASDVIVNFRDSVDHRDLMIVCSNTTCSPQDQASIQTLPTDWAPGACSALNGSIAHLFASP